MRSPPSRQAAALAAAALSLAGCGSASGGPKPEKNERAGRGGELTVLAPAVPRSLDPHRVPDATTAMAHDVVFRRLYVHVPGRAAPAADLAAGPAAISEDRLTITVPVRRTARFGPEGGRRITARDIEHGLERALGDPRAGPAARRLLGAVDGLGPVGAWRDVAGISAPDEDRLVVRLRVPTPEPVIEGLSTAASTPVPAETPRVLGAFPAASSVFSGAYAPELDPPSVLAPGALRLRRNPSWRGESDPRPAYADRITFRPGARRSAAWRTLAGTGLVLAPPAPPEVAKIAARRDAGQLAVAPLPVTRFVALNPAVAPLRDVHVRRALVASLDREGLLRAVRGGGSLASHYLPPSVPGHDESGGVDGTGAAELREPAGDPRLAAAELRRAGMDGGRYTGPVLRAVRGRSGSDAAIARVARASWRAIGVRLRVDVREGAALRLACTSREPVYAICLSASAGGAAADPEALLRPVARGRAGARVDAAMAASAELPAGDLRARAWSGINRAAVAMTIGAPWRWDERPLLVSRDVIGVVDEGTGTWELAFTSLDARARRAAP